MLLQKTDVNVALMRLVNIGAELEQPDI